ncbi:hypothetical protein SCFA_550008 [anaerobic digester metagenome]|uniref:Uncharacterized protein n=1 Tax=anaerobic digester metagenome TaxID=1263854 RepID=A0A485M2W8_9ZZZZ
MARPPDIEYGFILSTGRTYSQYQTLRVNRLIRSRESC